MSIYVTGDTHGSLGYTQKIKIWATTRQRKPNDILIVAGDFGMLWLDNELQNEHSLLNNFEQSYPDLLLLFVDGNHENFNLIEKLPVVNMFNGQVGQVKKNIFHLKRGEIYTIENKNILTYGGATSIDKAYREVNISWWPQEIPTEQTLQYCIQNLKKFYNNSSNQLDFVITHSCPEHIYSRLKEYSINFKHNHFKLYDDIYKHLNKIYYIILTNNNTVEWYFGHFHLDVFNIPDIFTDSTFTALYDNIIKIN